MTTGVRRRICGLCGQDKLWVGSEAAVRVRVCRACDSPGQPPTWELTWFPPVVTP